MLQNAQRKLESLRKVAVKELDDDSPFPIGSYAQGFRGKPLAKVPSWHLKWWLGKLQHKPENTLSGNERKVLIYILDNIDQIDNE